jgi:uncharacterized protein (TIGR01777 family)
MRVVVTGASGFIGRSVIRRLQRDGTDVVALVRDVVRAPSLLGPDVRCVDEAGLAAAIDGSGGVVNLAGEPMMPARWTQKKRERILSSRVGTTERIVAAIRAATKRPEALVSQSAVGFYGEHADGPCPEDRGPGSDFLAEVCIAWENAAAQAEALGVRVARVRTGFVLGSEEGGLGPMVTPFRLGVGGPLGRGDQPLSWIHVDDEAEVIVRLLGSLPLSGPVNLTAGTVPQRELAKMIGRVLHRPSAIPAPAPALKLLFGEASSTILGGQEVPPTALRRAGYDHRFPQLGPALEDVLDASSILVTDPSDVPDHPYLAERPPSWELRSSLDVAAPIDSVFAWFSHPENLPIVTPPANALQLRTPTPIEMREGTEIDYELPIAGLRAAWRTEVFTWDPPRSFVDVATQGPFRCWWHEHRFEPTATGTRIRDRVLFSAPLGPIGRAAEAAWVRPKLQRLFLYRRNAVRQRFGP